MKLRYRNNVSVVELHLYWVRLFFVEEFSPYSWAFLPADASAPVLLSGGQHTKPARTRVGSGGQPSLETVLEHRRSVPLGRARLLDIRAAFWYGAVGREA